MNRCSVATFVLGILFVANTAGAMEDVERMTMLVSRHGKVLVLETVLGSQDERSTIVQGGRYFLSTYKMKATNLDLVNEQTILLDMSRYKVSFEVLEQKLLQQEKEQIEGRQRVESERKRIDKEREPEDRKRKAEAAQRLKEARERDAAQAKSSGSLSKTTTQQGSGANQTQSVRIVSAEDISIKALTRPLSSYSSSEIQRLPVNVRKSYRIVVPSDISKEGLKTAMIDLVKQESSKNYDIDEIVVFAYDSTEDTQGPYTFGKMEWCPNGDWASMTPSIASSNDRSSYKYVFDIRGKVGNNTGNLVPTQEERRIYEIFTKALEKYENMEEDDVKSMVARQLNISTEEIDRISVIMLANMFR